MQYKIHEDLKQFLTPVREFTLHNATDEDVVLMYQGETRIVPASNKIAYPHPKFDDVCHSAKDSEGNWIPGTLVLRDVVQHHYNGMEASVWSAANAIKHALEIDVTSGAATGKYAARGLSLLPPNPSPELVKSVAEDGYNRFRSWRVQWATEVMRTYDDRIAALKASGHGSIPVGADYRRAKAVLDASEQALVESFKEDRETYAAVVQEEVSSSDEDIAKKLQEILSKSVGDGPAKSKEQLVNEIINDKEAMKLLREKFKMRKKADARPAS